jgi:hypothetical protein
MVRIVYNGPRSCGPAVTFKLAGYLRRVVAQQLQAQHYQLSRAKEPYNRPPTGYKLLVLNLNYCDVED